MKSKNLWECQWKRKEIEGGNAGDGGNVGEISEARNESKVRLSGDREK